MRQRQRRNRLGPAKEVVYVRCAKCGGKFDQELVQVIAGKIICGMCKLINNVWKQ